MKKLLLGLMAIACLSVTGCNANLTPGNYNFNYVHVQYPGDTKEHAMHYKVDKWKDDEGGIEVYVYDSKMNTGKVTMILGDGTFTLYTNGWIHDHGVCPICGTVTYE